MRDILRASSAIPGIFPPVEYENYSLVDGSASDSVPVQKVKEIGADRVLAVDVIRDIKSYDGKPQNLLDILYRTEDITSYHLSNHRLKEADLILRPDIKELYWTDFDKVEKIIYSGKKTAEENIEEIKKLVQRNVYLLGIVNYIKKLRHIN